MGLKAKSKVRIPCPKGNCFLVTTGVWVIGTQPGYQDQGPKMQAILRFECHNRAGVMKDKDGQTHTVQTFVGLSFSEKSTLTGIAGAIRGEDYGKAEIQKINIAGGFDVEDLLGGICKGTISHKSNPDGSIRDAVGKFTACDSDDTFRPKTETKPEYWDFTLGKPVPRNVAKMFKKSSEYLADPKAFHFSDEGEEGDDEEEGEETTDTEGQEADDAVTEAEKAVEKEAPKPKASVKKPSPAKGKGKTKAK
jgi:hypothetical protein